MKRLICALAAIGVSSCTGTIPEAARQGADPLEPGPGPVANVSGILPAPSGVRRLTRSELGATVQDLLGVDVTDSLGVLPEDSVPFDNDYTLQFPSEVLVNAVKTIAERAAGAVLAQPKALKALVACNTTDAACLGPFITRLGQRALRRPLAPAEVAGFQVLAAAQEDFPSAVAAVIRALLQDVELLYRVEVGTPDPSSPGLVRLGGWEMASRLSYLLLGTMPSDDLFALAAGDALGTPAQVRAAALAILGGQLGGPAAAKRSRERVNRFHAMWLRYDGQLKAADPLSGRLRAETNALLERVIFANRQPWLDIFRSTETFIDDTLAAYYGGGLAKPGSATPRWVSYGVTGRKGILSHGSYLSAGNSPDDTSTTRRGKHVRNELLCEEIPPPMPGMKKDGKVVDTSKPPALSSGECRLDRIRNDYLDGGCKTCHAKMDPIGIGLEQYDSRGKFRQSENGRPSCPVTGEGQLAVDDGKGGTVLETFRGPAGLTDLLLDHEQPRLGRCLVSQFLRFAGGRLPRGGESASVDAMTRAFVDGGYQFRELLLEHVSSPSFGYRLAE